MVQTYPVAGAIQLLTALLAVTLAVTALRRGTHSESLSFAVVGFGATAWALLSGLSSAVADPGLSYVLGFGIYPFSMLAAVGWLYLAADYTGVTWISNRSVVGTLALLPLLNGVTLATNPLHYQFLRQSTEVPASGIVEPVPGPLYWAHILLTTGILLVGLGFLVRESLIARGVYQEQTRAVIGSSLFPLAFSIAEVFDIFPGKGIDYGVIGLALGALVLFYALFSAEFLEVIQIQPETLMQNMGEAMIAIDSSGRVVDLNPKTTEYFGVDKTAIGSPLADVFDDVPELVAALSNGNKSDDISLSLDGETRHFTVVISPIKPRSAVRYQWLTSADEQIGRLISIRDVTARRERERRLQQYEKVVETAGDPIFVLDDDGTIELLNEAMVDFLDAPRNELVDSHIGNFLDPESLSKIMETITHLTVTGKSVEEYEMKRTESDGSVRHYEVNTRLIEDEQAEGDGIVGTVGVIRDVTAHEERKRELDQFASFVSHDLRNPLGIARTYLDFAEETGDSEDFEAVAEALDRMDVMIEDLLSFARMGSEVTDTELVDIEEVATDAWEHLDTTSATLAIDSTGTVDANPEYLLNVFENLFRNAREHNNEAVSLRVDVTKSDGDVDCLGIEDDGAGIPPDKRADIFDYGYTTETDGSGFGLAIVETIVDAHGWEITITDGQDGGARFEIETG